MKKKFYNHKLNVIRIFDQRNLGSIPRIFLSSLLVIFFFFSMPKIINHVNNKNEEFQNNSKAVLAYTLNNKGKNFEEGNEVLNENDLLRDIFSLNDLETDTVRLNASTIKQLFEDTNYTLQDVMGDKDYNTPSLVIGIFMSFYDVHINRIPYNGVIKYNRLEPIESTNKPMLAVEKDILNKVINPNNMDYLKYNERMLNKIYNSFLDYTYYIVQIADEDLNVIAPFKQQGDLCTQNERFSLIRWGSQVDLVLPLDKRFSFELLLKETMHVNAGLDKLIKINYAKN